MRKPNRPLLVTACTLELLALGVWMGGLATLGAIVAPTVFGTVSGRGAADAMTLVFAKFDRIAMSCAAIALVAEAVLAARGGAIGRTGVVRGGATVVASALAIGQGVWLTPTIASLHRAGAIRGLGEAGVELARTHRLAEASGKAQLAFALVAFALGVVKAATLAHSLQIAASRPTGPGNQPVLQTDP